MSEKINNDRAIIICKKAIDRWGYAMQKVVAMEECSELTEAIETYRNGEFHNVEEEVADVEIMCLQLRLIYGLANVDDEKMAMATPNKANLDSVAIQACASLIKSISKSIREKNSRIHESIARVEIVCEQLRNIFNRDKIEEYKQAKLIRLKELVW